MDVVIRLLLMGTVMEMVMVMAIYKVLANLSE
jgi:hypothetical protein